MPHSATVAKRRRAPPGACSRPNADSFSPSRFAVAVETRRKHVEDRHREQLVVEVGRADGVQHCGARDHARAVDQPEQDPAPVRPGRCRRVREEEVQPQEDGNRDIGVVEEVDAGQRLVEQAERRGW